MAQTLCITALKSHVVVLLAKSCPTLCDLMDCSLSGSSFATPWTVVCQAPLSMEFSRQEYQSELPFPSPGDLLTQGLNPYLLRCRRILYH